MKKTNLLLLGALSLSLAFIGCNPNAGNKEDKDEILTEVSVKSVVPAGTEQKGDLNEIYEEYELELLEEVLASFSENVSTLFAPETESSDPEGVSEYNPSPLLTAFMESFNDLATQFAALGDEESNGSIDWKGPTGNIDTGDENTTLNIKTLNINGNINSKYNESTGKATATINTTAKSNLSFTAKNTDEDSLVKNAAINFVETARITNLKFTAGETQDTESAADFIDELSGKVYLNTGIDSAFYFDFPGDEEEGISEFNGVAKVSASVTLDTNLTKDTFVKIYETLTPTETDDPEEVNFDYKEIAKLLDELFTVNVNVDLYNVDGTLAVTAAKIEKASDFFNFIPQK